MLFGYVFAVIAGFLLTAVRNWTGLPTPAGGALAAIAALWVTARALAFVSLPAAAAADALFAIAVAWAIGKPLAASGNRRNLFFVALVLALGAASVAFSFRPAAAAALGLDVVLFVMAVMGGRVIPAFTNNALPDTRARRVKALEIAALGSVLVLLALDFLDLRAAAAATALAAAVLHAARLALWAPLKTRARPILWILHSSYAWIVVHLALRGLGGLDVLSPVLATHALTVGAIGGLTLGMMTRTARGHTARPLVAGPLEVAAYVLVHAAAALRVFVPLAAPSLAVASIVLSAALWGAAFILYLAAFTPILSRPRLDGKPG